ncbi:alanine racemase [Nocardioides sp. KR10-350]|uniref:alanine racemase n=1 Tax=Nocardioides cheoyonin TaxID=3156615 RepID=UPI0032B432DF
MPLKLTVDGERWRTHLRSVADATQGLVPVAKGNGYGLTLARLARRAGWLGSDVLAVGTYAELPEVASRYDGSLVVLTPWRPYVPDLVPDLADRVIHTVSRYQDLPALLGRQPGARVLLERMTSMRRHGMSAAELWEAAPLARRRARFEGVSIHLPMTGHNLPEARALMDDVVGAEAATVWVSHLTPSELEQLRTSYADLTVRPRVGTGLWLGDRGAFRATATVDDVHPLERGDGYGYRGRTALRNGHLLVAAGGTGHGLGLEAPTGAPGLRSRAVAVAKGGLDAVGVARSPYLLDGRSLLFAEPPHMQESMLLVPHGHRVPEVGDELEVRVRYTTTTFDEITVT